ncbi:MAG TPA: AMP-dependent synthetase/ligase [Polyangiaceae bacterium LLY-WYZ-15_(1-7)]|nr:AMP-dependent synthetase/ligase [Polyangiaceae bacterium LLY-WYZ-15_(1-7)]HJL07312.1 AMP-dependent synthetase/ligase [Polyangiaceae bacterium LLY-WYZ-15_(1-7)]HJL25959.1 AMP-dependent synthetase/ligase [Polyangiaceae bacterium LLY-WYZ-15_(1-7)]HJL30353.1 AMP-dependent synthetase/ligase [Polyangiaceae bacterium LLY-WYZ-15_(1-7)]HJL48675.1 AMP-dependent synthetase/ligase [Polyangiaceae bacterium LLY-WYZ-15_(1-7)]
MADTIPSRLLEQVRRTPHAPAYHVREGGIWRATSWAEYGTEVSRAARALIALGCEPGHTVTILGFNRPEWVVLDLACMAAGGAPAGIYTTCSPDEVAYIVNHSQCPLILVENEDQWKKIEEKKGELPALKHVVTMKGTPAIDDEMVMSWEEFLAKGDEVEEKAYHDRVEALEPDALATLIYTSGTTGPPKGVMLSHHNLAWTAKAAQQLVNMQSHDCALSYLPLSHIAEQMFTIHGPVTAGASVYFAESIEKVPDNLKEVQPTVFFGVPRIWEKFQAGIAGKLKEATGAKKKLVEWAMDVGLRTMKTREQGREPGFGLAMQHKLADKLIFSKLKPAVGLGRARICVTGAAPIAREVLEFFAGLDILVLEVYGQSEDCGPTSFNQPERFRYGTVGPAIPGVEVKIADDDEILVKGPNVFMGYYKDEDATKETLDEKGWLHSGDLGSFEDGFLKIIGRKKEIIITAGGKSITPKNIEAALKNHELINEAVVIGDRRKFLSALVTIDPDAGPAWAKEKGVDPETLHESDALRAEIQSWVDEINKKFARVEQVKKFTILPRNLTVEDGELTPTLKVKRRIVDQNWGDAIDAMYE